MRSRLSRAAAAKVFMHIGQAGRAAGRRCEWTLPLFPLVLILDADGTLAADARHLVSPPTPRIAKEG